MMENTTNHCSTWFEKLPQVTGKQAFLFSTSRRPDDRHDDEYVAKNHAPLREKLQAKAT